MKDDYENEIPGYYHRTSIALCPVNQFYNSFEAIPENYSLFVTVNGPYKNLGEAKNTVAG